MMILSLQWKGFLLKKNSKISLNIYFEDKLKSRDDLIHLIYDYGQIQTKEFKGSMLSKTVSEIIFLLKKELFDKYFEKPAKTEKPKKSKSSLLVDNQPRNISPLLSQPWIDPSSINRPHGQIGRPRPNYPGLYPYIRYGKCLFVYN